MLGTSDAWSTSHLSWQTSKPVYYIVDCRILKMDRFASRSGLKFIHSEISILKNVSNFLALRQGFFCCLLF